jgi:DNA-binding NarL/FixJ family response regulator
LKIRVLVVDDFEPWRRFASVALQRQPDMQIVGEASDGPVAVQKAQQLRPDLILLDIGLPGLNGIQAARQIRERSLRSKILFVTENHSSETAKLAFRAGGRGYVVKSRAGSELLLAIRAVLRGEFFASASLGLAGYESMAEMDYQPAPNDEQSYLMGAQLRFFDDDPCKN